MSRSDDTELSTASSSVAALLAGLRGDAKDRAAFRKQASQIAESGRPFEQLPAALRRALRDDARTLLGRGGGGETLSKAGYGRVLSRHLARDLGFA